jgi:hypothetical protein
MVVKATKDYKVFSDGNLDTKAMQVLTGTGGSAKYVSLAAKLAIMQTSKDAFSASLSVARYGSTTQKLQRNADRLVLLASMDDVCDGVNYVTPGDEISLAETNFTLSAANPSPVIMQQLKKFLIKNGVNPGTVLVQAIKGDGAMLVKLEYSIGNTLGPDSIWTPCGNSKNKFTIEGLPSAETVWVRATSVGRRGQILYASPIKTIIL